MTGPRRFTIAVLLLGVALLGLGLARLTRTVATAVGQRPAVALRSCELPDGIGAGKCGTLEVYENRAAKSGRKLQLNIVVVPALGSTSIPNAVFWLDGGPGGAATQAVGPVSRQYLAGLRSDHDLVFVDQRGTGQSHPLRCGDVSDTPANLDTYYGKLFPRLLIRACREALEPIADLTQYTTSNAMDDLDDVRAALGYAKINLAGASYGTLAAQVYMRQHPDRVRAAFLVGVATPAFKLPLPFARASQHAWERVVSACAADRDCAAAFPNLQAELDAVLGRFAAGPLEVTMVDPTTRQARLVSLEREAFVERLRAMLYTTYGARFVPYVVHRAYLRDFEPLQAAGMRFRPGGSGARGMYFSVTCSESVPFITEQEIAEETRGTFLGDRRTRAHIAACEEWPKARIARTFLEPVKSNVPVILFSGGVDGSTPPWVAEQAVEWFSNGRLITAPNTGHQIDGPCSWDLMQTFFRDPAPRAIQAACAVAIRRPPFHTAGPIK